MLNSILIENFKSYKSQRLPLAPLTLMIGANASGKTNAIEAFRFLSWVVGGEKLSTIKNRINDSERIFRGDVRDIFKSSQEPVSLGAMITGLDQESCLEFSIRFFVKNETLHIQREFLRKNKDLLYHTQGHDGSFLHVSTALPKIEILKNSKIQRIFECKDDFAVIHQIYPTTYDTQDQVYLDGKKDLDLTISAISNVIFFDLIPSDMRSDSYPENQLRNTGANLAGVLYTLWQQPDQQTHILEFIQSLPEQDIKELKFYEDHRGRVELALIETFGHQEQEQSIELLSDGTLRVLAIAAALLSAPEGSTVVIEEVDNGVHPSRAKQLLTTMREHAERRNLRLLLSTHNPALMDALPDEALGDVVFCYRDPTDGDSRLVRLSDLDDYMGLVMQGSLGQLVTRGIVDRFVKNPVTPEEKKQKALDWLAMMQGDDE